MSIEVIYRSAVAFNSWWVKRILRVHLDIRGELPQRDRNLIIICNHRSWFDILVLHAAIIRHSPIIKFLIKRQLVDVPVLGWICLALSFPRLYRTHDPEHRARDHQAIAAATSSLNEYPTALLNFAEGTRYAPDKHKAQQSPWQYLLKPTPGGLRIILEHAENAAILDMTLVYPQKEITFWTCLAGTLPYAKVYLEYFEPDDIKDAAEWLNQRWSVKESLISRELT
jgi:1-acyl-sn-glycerol-3-phosphate acyltransferase